MTLKGRIPESVLRVEKPISLTRFGSRNGGSGLAQLNVNSVGGDLWDRGDGSRMVMVRNRNIEV